VTGMVCTRCVMDESAPDIRFDEEGVCNYCTDYLVTRERYLVSDPAQRQRRLDALLDKVRRDGRGKRYDCIVGISGGVDSSWALVKAVELGLRPLAVHMDNGWNAELAQNNIANLVRGLGVDLVTHVIDWREYGGLMEAFFAADVLDVELLYDNAMSAVNFLQAARFGVKHMLGGTNVATEGMRMPPGWNWFKFDKRNIKAISARFGGPRLKSFPAIGTIDFIRIIFRVFAGTASWIISNIGNPTSFSSCRANSVTNPIPSNIMSPSSRAFTKASSCRKNSASISAGSTCLRWS
jgi:hypothetical protein